MKTRHENSNTATALEVRQIVAETMGLSFEAVLPKTMILNSLDPSMKQSARIWNRLRKEHGVPVPEDCISFGAYPTIENLIEYAEGRWPCERRESEMGLKLVEHFEAN